MLVPVFETKSACPLPSQLKAVEKTDVGKTSEVFESAYGYEIIQRTR